MDRENLSMALITPARNEEQFIGKTISSVLAQTIKPVRWVIVSDGSTDSTDEIVKKYAEDNTWIELTRMPEHRDRQFAAKVHCFNAGLKLLANHTFEIIGNLDADVSFDDESYFEYLLEMFACNKRLGVAGTPFIEEGYRSYDGLFTSFTHVSGACQLFRKECFEQIGGYIPIKGGGIDWVAVTTARMKGWNTQTFTEKQFRHHRKMGTGNSSFLMSRFRHGQKDYYLGGHPLWELFRGLYQMTRKPYIIAGLYLLAGYTFSFLTRVKRPLSPELIRFHRREQMQRLREIIKSRKERNRNTTTRSMRSEYREE